MYRVVKDIIGRYLTLECESCDVANYTIMPAGGRIYYDDFLVVYSHLYVPLLGYIVIAPKKHYYYFKQMTDEENNALMSMAMTVVDALKKFNISEEFSVIKIEGNDHAKIWVMPRLSGIFEDDKFDFKLLENRYSMERRSIPVAEPNDILYLNARLKTFFKNIKR